MVRDQGVLQAIADVLKNSCNVDKYAFFLDDGKILESTMSKENSEKISKTIKFYSRQMLVNNYFNQDSSGINFLLYRLSNSVFLSFLSKETVPKLVSTLTDVFNKYSKKLDKIFHDVPDSFRKITKYLVISQGLAMGPEPVAWYPDDIPDNIRMKIAMKSMLMLTAEREGAIRGIPATIPFIEYYAMGVIFLFDTPHTDARGGAYDSCISILVDESYRPAIYENMFSLENLCIDAADLITSGEDLEKVIKSILIALDAMNLRSGRQSYEIEQLMKGQLKKITENLNGI
ncbi:hypothetical protein GF325_16620 [Candidatus Bathyarchaeota archaeon]|nr:hypothetical protein [Candidatus Bathyarchaeota archaeon]